MLSKIDKKILKILLDSNGKITFESLAKKMNLPRTTVQRRRLALEKFLHISYTLKLEELGFRRIDFLISTEKGKTVSLAKDLLKRDEVVFVGRSVGQHAMDLKVEIIIKNKEELPDLLESIRGMTGVKAVKWVEIIERMGKKKSISSILKRL